MATKQKETGSGGGCTLQVARPGESNAMSNPRPSSFENAVPQGSCRGPGGLWWYPAELLTVSCARYDSCIYSVQ